MSSLLHTNNRLRGTHWARSPELSEPRKTHCVGRLNPYSPKPYSARFSVISRAEGEHFRKCFLLLAACFASRGSSAYWKATKEYLNQRGTKIRVFRVFSRAPLSSHPFCLIFPLSSPSGPVHSPTTSPLFTSPFFQVFLTPGKLQFRYPSDLGTL